jgi:hypothetical protein
MAALVFTTAFRGVREFRAAVEPVEQERGSVFAALISAALTVNFADVILDRHDRREWEASEGAAHWTGKGSHRLAHRPPLSSLAGASPMASVADVVAD